MLSPILLLDECGVSADDAVVFLSSFSGSSSIIDSAGRFFDRFSLVSRPGWFGSSADIQLVFVLRVPCAGLALLIRCRALVDFVGCGSSRENDDMT